MVGLAQTLKLAEFDRSYLDLSWRWLNDPEIKLLTMTPDFTREDQEAFFASLSNRRDYLIWGLNTGDGTPIGACGIKKIVEPQGEFWCYIGEKHYWGQGFGLEALRLCEEQARVRGLRVLTMVSDRTNRRSINAYRKAGFVELPQSGDPAIVHLSKTVAQ